MYTLETTSSNVFWVVVSNILYFHPYLGKIPNLTNIFRWVETTNQFWFMYFMWALYLCHGRAQDIDRTVEFLANMILWAMACFVLPMLDPLNLPPKHPKTVSFCGLFVHRCQGLSKGGTGKGISNLNNYIQARWQRFECVFPNIRES